VEAETTYRSASAPLMGYFILAHLTVYPALCARTPFMMSILDERPGTFWPIGYH